MRLLAPNQKPQQRFYSYIAQKMNFFIKYFSSKCDQIPRKLQLLSHSLRKSLMANFSFLWCYSLKKIFLAGSGWSVLSKTYDPAPGRMLLVSYTWSKQISFFTCFSQNMCSLFFHEKQNLSKLKSRRICWFW